MLPRATGTRPRCRYAPAAPGLGLGLLDGGVVCAPGLLLCREAGAVHFATRFAPFCLRFRELLAPACVRLNTRRFLETALSAAGQSASSSCSQACFRRFPRLAARSPSPARAMQPARRREGQGARGAAAELRSLKLEQRGERRCCLRIEPHILLHEILVQYIIMDRVCRFEKHRSGVVILALSHAVS